MSRPCECGCGEPAPVWKETNRSRGRIRGESARFIHGHNGRGTGADRSQRADGYMMLRRPDHHRADPRGWVREHVVVAERALGRPIEAPHEVHHVNENRAENRPSNLVICEDRAYHRLLHTRKRALEACGHADWRPCGHCGEYDDPKNLRIDATNCVHPACHAEYCREWKVRRSEAAA